MSANFNNFLHGPAECLMEEYMVTGEILLLPVRVPMLEMSKQWRRERGARVRAAPGNTC